MAELKITLVNGELAGKTMQDINKQVREAQKELSKAKIGTEEFVKAQQKLEDAKGIQADLTEQIKGTTKASEMLRAGWNKFPLAGIFNQAAESVGMMRQGVGGLVSQFGLLKTAIIGTGIGALVVLLGSLVNWIKNVNTGADFLEDTLASLGAIVDVLTGRLGKLFSGLVEFFSGNFSEGIDMMADSFKGVGDEIARDVELIRELTAARRDLEDAEIDYKVKAAETENQIKRLLLQARNRSLSEQERIAFLDQAMAKEKELNEELLKNSEEALRIANMDAARILNIEKEKTETQIQFGKRILEEFKRDGQVQNDEMRDAVVDMLIALEDAGGKSLALQEKIQNQRDALAEKEAAAREKKMAAQDKELEAWLKKYEQRELDAENIRLSRIEASAAREKKIIQDKMALAADAIAKEIAAQKAAAEELKQIELAKQQMQAASLMTFNEGVTSIIALLGAEESARKRNAERIKFFETARVTVNGIAEISEIAKTFATLGPLGQVLAAARIAFASFRTIAGVKRIQATKFALGGPVNGPSHAGGGVPIEAEGGEFIFSRKAVQAIGMPVLDAINKRMTFANGGPVNPYGSAGSSAQAGSALFDLNKLAVLIDQAMENKLMRLQVVNSVGDTEKGIKVLNQIRNEADV